MYETLKYLFQKIVLIEFHYQKDRIKEFQISKISARNMILSNISGYSPDNQCYSTGEP